MTCIAEGAEGDLSMDLIDRQAAIDAMGIEPLAFSEYENGLYDKWEEDVEALMKLPSAQSEQRWIPVSERLPEEEGWYLVTVHPDYIVPDSMHTDSLYWLDGKWWFYDYDARTAVWLDPIIAWMPLPEPYEERWEE